MNTKIRGVSDMTSSTSNVSFRIDTDIKNQADRLFSQLGMNMTTAFNIFLRQAVREGSIPFPVTVNTPNAATVAAMLEAERIASDMTVKRYSDVEEALRELKA
jgi:DNA-damage-inducible protein J